MWPFRRWRRGRWPDALGRRGERLAARCLRRAGCRILARNYRCPAGEADIIALTRSTRPDGLGETIVFAEVKTRSDDGAVDPASAVDARKRRRLVRVAKYYLAHHHTGDRDVRFDVVTVVLPPDGPARVNHVPDAFGPG